MSERRFTFTRQLPQLSRISQSGRWKIHIDRQVLTCKRGAFNGSQKGNLCKGIHQLAIGEVRGRIAMAVKPPTCYGTGANKLETNVWTEGDAQVELMALRWQQGTGSWSQKFESETEVDPALAGTP